MVRIVRGGDLIPCAESRLTSSTSSRNISGVTPADGLGAGVEFFMNCC